MNITRVKCPTCKTTVEWTAAFPYKPFCSDRCRLIDLGDWLTEANRIPETNNPQTGEFSDTDKDDAPF